MTECTFGANLTSRDRGFSGLGECSIHQEIRTISRQSSNKVLAGTCRGNILAGTGIGHLAPIPYREPESRLSSSSASICIRQKSLHQPCLPTERVMDGSPNWIRTVHLLEAGLSAGPIWHARAWT